MTLHFFASISEGFSVPPSVFCTYTLCIVPKFLWSLVSALDFIYHFDLIFIFNVKYLDGSFFTWFDQYIIELDWCFHFIMLCAAGEKRTVILQTSYWSCWRVTSSCIYSNCWWSLPEIWEHLYASSGSLYKFEREVSLALISLYGPGMLCRRSLFVLIFYCSFVSWMGLKLKGERSVKY